MKHILLLLSVLLALAGCASSGAAWISAAKFDYRRYQGLRVAVVPVATPDYVDPKTLSLLRVQDAIAEQLYLLDIDDVTTVDPEDARDLTFPYTPERLAKYGRDHDYVAVVGATFIRLDERPVRSQWSLTGNITFVDSNRPERRWTIAKTWDMTGKPSGGLAWLQLGSALRSDFIEVRRALRRGSVSALLGRDTVVVDAGPIVNLDLVDVIAGPSNEVKQIVRTAPDGTVPTQSAHVDVFAIDDAGIASLQLVNPNASFATWVWGEPELNHSQLAAQKSVEVPIRQVAGKAQANESASASLSLPQYLSHRLPVDIAAGTNDIQAIAINGKGQRVTRNLVVQTEVQGDAPIDMMVIAATKLGLLPAARLSEPADQRFKKLAAKEGTSFGNGARVVTFTGEQASRASVVRTITMEWARPTAGSRRVLAFMGRAEAVNGRPYFMLDGTDAEYPQIGSMSIDDLLSLMDLGVATATLDLCTNASSPAEIETAIRGLGDRRIEVAVNRGCERPVGGLFVELETDELPR